MSNPSINANGDKFWYNELGQIHRDDGPAVEWRDGGVWWYNNGLRHRIGGPAIVYSNPNSFSAWYIDDKRYSEEEYDMLIFFRGIE